MALGNDAHIPYDDEPLTEDDIQAIEQAKKDFSEGKTFSLMDIEDGSTY